MKSILTLLLIFLTIGSKAQYLHQLSETDTTVNYKAQFYPNGVLDLNGYYVYTIDSASYFSSDTKYYYDFTKKNFDLDSSVMYRLKQGKWMNQYTRNKKKYFSLAEYSGDVLTGERYDFREDGSLYSVFRRYPRIKDTVFNGSQVIYYDKKGENITSIEYILFNEDQTNLFFLYVLFYAADGKLTYYFYDDEKAGMYHSTRYNKKGELMKETIRNATEWSEKRWNFRRTKMKFTSDEKQQKHIRIYRKDKLVKEKIKEY